MNKKKIIYIQYTNPAGYPPLEHSSRILSDRGWQVTFLGCGASGEADRFEFPPHDNIRVLKWKFPKPGWRQKLHFFLWTWWAVWVTFRSGARWIYASEHLSCPATWFANFLPGRRVIYHEHDSPPDKDLSSFMKSLLKYRKSVCDGAAAAILPNVERARIFQEKVKPKCAVHVVWNCPEKCEVLDRPPPTYDKYILFYHGSLNYSRLPVSVLDALTILPRYTELQFAGYTTRGAPNFITDYLEEAKKRGLEGRVQYLGAPRYRFELLTLCSQAHLGLAFMPIQSDDLNMVAMAGASNKPFDYLACGLNLLVSDLPDWHKLFVESGFARSCQPDDPKSIASAVLWHLDHPLEAGRDLKHGKKRILEEWNYESQFAPIFALIHR